MREFPWIDVYMNQPRVKAELGAPDGCQYQACNIKMNKAFVLQGDGMRDSKSLLPELLNDGVRLLVYAGNTGTPSLCLVQTCRVYAPPFADMLCNYMVKLVF
jgi:carboxypeptidase C (cathepsin A)